MSHCPGRRWVGQKKERWLVATGSGLPTGWVLGRSSRRVNQLETLVVILGVETSFRLACIFTSANDATGASVSCTRRRHGVFMVEAALPGGQLPFAVAEHGAIFAIVKGAALDNALVDRLTCSWQGAQGNGVGWLRNLGWRVSEGPSGLCRLATQTHQQAEGEQDAQDCEKMPLTLGRHHGAVFPALLAQFTAQQCSASLKPRCYRNRAKSSRPRSRFDSGWGPLGAGLDARCVTRQTGLPAALICR
jgi:hypothetical protein